MNNKFIAYTRVSTARQSTQGVSLAEQQRAIRRYAKQHHLTIMGWCEEQCSAAKRGRLIFDDLVKELQRRHGSVGLLLHKVDRGARNLRDWASIGEAIDLGVDVRFAQDDFDMNTRGGRLAADIQAVIAADYIRNLREEVQKGIRGRLKQGLLPMKAPRGYRDRGPGQAKTPDPIIAPLIIACFERYETGRYTLKALAQEMATVGLRTRTNQPLSPEQIRYILRNPFYKGTVRVRGTCYPGVHQPLVTQDLFETVQRRLKQRTHHRRARHHFRYAGQLRCRACSYPLTGERQKKHVYYRCHRCPSVSVREDRVSESDLVPSGALVPYQKFESR